MLTLGLPLGGDVCSAILSNPNQHQPKNLHRVEVIWPLDVVYVCVMFGRSVRSWIIIGGPMMHTAAEFLMFGGAPPNTFIFARAAEGRMLLQGFRSATHCFYRICLRGFPLV
jgi:hypothetical protein